MTQAEKARLTGDLQRASRALADAFRSAAAGGELDLAKGIRDQQKALGALIARTSGGPVVSMAELLR